MFRFQQSLFHWSLVVGLSCAFVATSAADKKPKKPPVPPPAASKQVPVPPKAAKNVVPKTGGTKAPKSTGIVAPKVTKPAATKPSTGTPSAVPGVGVVKSKPSTGLLAPGTLKLNPQTNPLLHLPKIGVPGVAPKAASGNTSRVGSAVAKPKIAIKPSLGAPALSTKLTTAPGNPQGSKGTFQLAPQKDPNVALKLNPQPEPPGKSTSLAGSKGVLQLNPQPEPPGKPHTGASGVLTLKTKPLAVPKNGIMTLTAPRSVSQALKIQGIIDAQNKSDSGKVLQLVPDSGKVLQLVPDSGKVLQLAPDSGKVLQLAPEDSHAAKARGMIASDKQRAAQQAAHRHEVLQGLFGEAKSNKTSVATILPLGVDNPDGGPATIYGNLPPDGEPATIKQNGEDKQDEPRGKPATLPGSSQGGSKREVPLTLPPNSQGGSKREVPLTLPQSGEDNPQGEPATILPLETDNPQGEPAATILPLGTDEPQGEPAATLMQFKGRDRMARALQTLQASPQLQAELGLQNLNLDKVSGVHQQRLASIDNFANWKNSEADQQLGLLQQFEMQTHGDLSRRMDLSTQLLHAGGWAQSRQHGVLAPTFTTSAFSSWYAGGGAYPAHSWSPHWSPWVDWSWWDTCPVIYDPRPYYCIPVVYQPCLPWVYHNYPVWQPLPGVACGTWLDVAPVVLTSGWDVQLLAVRFVDNGHPEQNQGPRYRVWAVNNSPQTIETPVSVQLLASNEQTPAIDLPQAGVVVPWMEAGEVQVFDIRLPLAVNQLGTTAKGQRVPFHYLHVLVDSHQQIPETSEDNNGAVLDRRDILPIDPSAFSTDVTATAPDRLLAIAGEGFGPEPGQVILLVGDQQVQAEIFGWYDLGVQFAVPNFELTAPVEAEVVIVRGDGAASNPLTVQLAPQELLQTAEAEAAVPEEAPLPE